MRITFGQCIAELRKRKGLTGRQLAELAGLSHPTVGRIELDDLAPTKRVAEKLADALNIPKEKLVEFAFLTHQLASLKREYSEYSNIIKKIEHIEDEEFDEAELMDEADSKGQDLEASGD